MLSGRFTPAVVDVFGDGMVLLDARTIILLVVIAFVAGICITAIGPGGVFVTVSLAVLLPISPAAVAGAASTSFIGIGILGSAEYLRSGELGSSESWEMAIILSATAIPGAQLGTSLNLLLPAWVFMVLLTGFLLVLPVVIIVRELRGLESTEVFARLSSRGRRALLGCIGVGIGILGSMLGVGGPVILVPLLVVLGVPTLVGVAVAQVQSVFLSSVASIGYVSAGVVSPFLVAIIMIPQLVGGVCGWTIAHRLPPRLLRIVLGCVLLASAPLLVV